MGYGDRRAAEMSPGGQARSTSAPAHSDASLLFVIKAEFTIKYLPNKTTNQAHAI